MYTCCTTLSGGDPLESYVGFVMILNFFVDLLVLCGTDRLVGLGMPVKAAIPGAAVGAVYAGICLLTSLALLTGTAARIIVLLVMALLTYGVDLRAWAMFVMMMITIGGITTGFAYIGKWELMVCVLCGVVMLVTAKRVGFRSILVPMELSYQDKSIQVMALCDTGNGLRDPITGESVIVVSPQIAFDFTGLTKQQLSKPTEYLSSLPGGRLIPYRAVGTDSGFLMATRFPMVKVGKRKSSALVAFAPAGFQTDGSFQALIGRVS